MNIKEFEEEHKIRFKYKNEIWFMRFIGFFFSRFMTDFWTTYRLPGQLPTITCPIYTIDPMSARYQAVREHELIHCKNIRTFWGLVKMAFLVSIFPLPIIFSGRWFVERRAYLHNILHHGYDMESVVNVLWYSYGLAWPKPLMRKWFKKKIAKHNKGV